jgi:hypothetical protein
MAKEPGDNDSADKLREEIAQSRQLVARNVRGVRGELDFPRKIRRSFQRQPAGWIVGAIAIGLVLTAVSTRKKKVYVEARSGRKTKSKLLEAGFALGALRIAATLLKPFIVSFVTRKVGGFGDHSQPARKW